MSAAQKMTRSQIVDEAKGLVLSHGPDYMLEFGSEYVARRFGEDWEANPDAEAVLQEAYRQARRVYRFLGYIAPGEGR